MIMASASRSLHSVVSTSLVGNSAAFGAAAKAMSELGVAGCVGAFCVHQKFLTAPMVSALSKTTFSILLPCFLGTSIVKTIVTQGLPLTSLGVPIASVLHAFLLFVLSKIIILPLFGLDPNTITGRTTSLSCAWGNAATVPLIFLEALFRGRPGMVEECYSFVSLVLVGWSPFFWSYGRSILLGSVQEEEEEQNAAANAAAAVAGTDDDTVTVATDMDMDVDIDEETVALVMDEENMAAVAETTTRVGSAAVGMARSKKQNGTADNNNNNSQSETPSIVSKLLKPISCFASKEKIIKTARLLLPPPVVGVFVGMGLALSPLQPLFMSSGDGKGAPLSVIYNCFENLGRAANPLAVLVLTSSLALGVLKAREEQNANANTNTNTLVNGSDDASIASSDDSSAAPAALSAEEASISRRRYASVAVARFLVSPILMVGLMKMFHKVALLPSLEAKPVVWFVLLLESCMPPAQNTVLMLQVANKPEEASKMAQFLFGMYATSMIPIVLVVSVALKVCKLA